MLALNKKTGRCAVWRPSVPATVYVLCQTKYSTHAQRAEPSGFFGFKPPAGRHCTQCIMHANPIGI